MFSMKALYLSCARVADEADRGTAFFGLIFVRVDGDRFARRMDFSAITSPPVSSPAHCRRTQRALSLQFSCLRQGLCAILSSNYEAFHTLCSCPPARASRSLRGGIHEATHHSCFIRCSDLRCAFHSFPRSDPFRTFHAPS